MNEKPRHFLIFKLLGLAGAIVAITGVVLIISGFGDFGSNKFMIGGFLMPIGVILGALGLMIGFSPEIARTRVKTEKYIQEENKDDLATIASNNAEIMNDAVTTISSAAHEGMRATKFCKHCGEKIDADARFCQVCGKEQ